MQTTSLQALGPQFLRVDSTWLLCVLGDFFSESCHQPEFLLDLSLTGCRSNKGRRELSVMTRGSDMNQTFAKQRKQMSLMFVLLVLQLAQPIFHPFVHSCEGANIHPSTHQCIGKSTCVHRHRPKKEQSCLLESLLTDSHSMRTDSIGRTAATHDGRGNTPTPCCDCCPAYQQTMLPSVLRDFRGEHSQIANSAEKTSHDTLAGSQFSHFYQRSCGLRREPSHIAVYCRIQV